MRRSVAFIVLLAVSTPAVVLGLATAAGASPSITAVVVRGTEQAPSITVTGSGFGADVSALGPPSGLPLGACGTGFNYGSNFIFTDSSRSWEAGHAPGDCVGVLISSYTDTQIVFTFGSYYPNYLLVGGDAFTMDVLGGSFSGTVPEIVRASNPPVVATVSPGHDAVWAVSISNYFSASMTGGVATVTATANGSTPLGFDNANMPDCSLSEGTETCHLPDIPAGNVFVLNVYVPTDALSVGTIITGHVDYFSSSTMVVDAFGSLNTVTLASPPPPGGPPPSDYVVAKPGVPSSSRSGPPTDANPTEQIITLPNQPGAKPVLVLLKSVTPGPTLSPADKLLCPTSGTKCSGQISVFAGNFKQYANKKFPIQAQIIAKWKQQVPPGKIVMAKDIGGPPVQLAPCVVKGGTYNTPCAKPEIVKGSAAANNLTTTDTILFVATDPRFAWHVTKGPDAPVSVKATAGAGKATVTWKAPVVTNGVITAYSVTPHLGKTALKAVTVAGTARRATITGLKKGKAYTFTIVARTAKGVSLASKASNAVKPT